MAEISSTFFLSYSRSDALFADALESDLTSLGFKLWMDRRKLVAGERFTEEIRQAITGANAVIVILSPRAARSHFVQQEIQFAQALKKLVFPILLKPCRVPNEIAEINWADFSKSYDAGWRELMLAFERARINVPITSTAPTARQNPSPPKLDAWDRWLNVPNSLKVIMTVTLIFCVVLVSWKVVLVRTPVPKVFRGHIQTFSLAQNDLAALGRLGEITRGPDGLIWFAAGDSIGQISVAGAYKGFPLQPDSGAFGVTAGPDGSVWFTETNSDHIGRITPDGEVKEFAWSCSHTALDINCGLSDIIRGPDDNLWFTESNTNRIGRISPDGEVKEFAVPNFCPSGTTCAPYDIWS